MMMQVLAAANVPLLVDDARPNDSSNPKGYFEYAPVKTLADDEASHDWLADARGGAVKVVSPLLPRLPRDRPYRVLLMLRPVSDIIHSQNQMLKRRGEPQDTSEAFNDLYAAHLSSTKAFLARHAIFETLHVHFDRAVEEPEHTAACVADFLNLDCDVRTMAGEIQPALRHR